MAPWDSGSVMNLRLVDPLGERVGPSPEDHATIGSYLRAVREHRGLTLAHLADQTKIRREFLRGLEEGDHSVLPPRAFAIGYMRSYAEALGIDGVAASARFKKEAPDFAEPLRNPVGVKHETKKRSPLVFAVIGLVLSGVVLWNVAQRGLTSDASAEPVLPVVADSPAAKGPIALSVAVPAPPEQNMPVPYVTPGLDGSVGGAKIAAAPVSTSTAPNAPSAYATATFEPKGAVYGAPAAASSVVLQTHKAASLIVRGAGGAVYFARQLRSGEAYRAPLGQGLTAEVTDPAAFDLYVAGEAKGALSSEKTPVDKLIAPRAGV